MDFTAYIKPELLILIPVLYLLGMALKSLGSARVDRLIPLVLGAAGVVLALVWVCAVSRIDGGQAAATALFTAFTQGILAAGSAVYGSQIIKQATK